MISPLDPHRSIEPGSAEETLRLIANLPAPDDLADRIHAALRTAPRTATILHWPVGLTMNGNLLRGAAAAAIVCIVAGGGWTIYSRVPLQSGPRVIMMPQRSGNAGGFGAAGLRRVPQTLDAPVLTHSPATTAPAAADGSEEEPAKLVVAPRLTAKPAARPHKKLQLQPKVSPVH